MHADCPVDYSTFMSSGLLAIAPRHTTHRRAHSASNTTTMSMRPLPLPPVPAHRMGHTRATSMPFRMQDLSQTAGASGSGSHSRVHFAEHAANGGRAPFINPGPLSRWAYGRALPAGRKEEAVANKTVFMDWWASEVVKTDPVTCSDSLFLYPQSQGRTRYRNQYGRCVRLVLGCGCRLRASC